MPTTNQVLDWYEQRSPHTKAYEQYLLKQLVNSTIEDVSLRENIGYEAFVGVLNRQVDTEINWDEIEDLGTIGIEEVALSKGRKSYAAIISARQKNGQVRVLAVLPDRKKEYKRFSDPNSARLQPTIRAFTTDMWEAYVTAVEEYIAAYEAVTAHLVIDRFHVAEQYRASFDTFVNRK